MGISSMAGTYFNFITGTGSEEVGKMIKRQIKNRKVNNQSYFGAMYKGTKKGIGYSYKLQGKNGGYFKNIKAGFKAIPDGFKNGKGIFGKIKGGIKGCGKAMPALMALTTLIAEAPNIFKATKEKGIGQGAKELGKAGVRLTTGALCAAIGSAILPVGGSLVGWFVGDWIGSKIVGKSYSEKVEDAKANPEEVPSGETGIVAGGAAPGGGTVQFPSIDADDFGPHKPYANVFFNNPLAHQNMGFNLPGQNAIYGTYGMFPMMGFGVSQIPNNESPNLLSSNGQGNLLSPTGPQNAYYQKPQAKQGVSLDITK